MEEKDMRNMRYLTNEPGEYQDGERKASHMDNSSVGDEVHEPQMDFPVEDGDDDGGEGEEEDSEKGIYTLRRAFEFEGKMITELDISSLDEIRGKDIDKARSILRAKGRGEETGGYFNAEFCFTLLSVMSGIPLELFLSMYSVDYIILQKVVERFLLRMG